MLYKILKPVAYFLAHLFCRFDITGTENIPDDKAVIYCSNHISMFDFLFIGVHVKSELSFLGKAEIAKIKPLAWFIGKLGFIPIKRGASDITAVRKVIDTLKGGRSVLVFVQGTRKKKVPVRETEPKKGAALMQKKAECPIVPVSVTNEKMKVGLFSKVKIRFGKCISYDEVSQFDSSDATKYIFDKIIALSEEK